MLQVNGERIVVPELNAGCAVTDGITLFIVDHKQLIRPIHRQ